MSEISKNIARAWEATDDVDKAAGAISYGVYRSTLERLADYYGLGIVPVVEAFVALSPNNDYHGNLRSLASVLEAWVEGREKGDWTVSTYKACSLRAWEYILGNVSFLDTVGGRKIRSFRDNILYLEKSKMVTVDGHMISIGLGYDMTMKEANFAMRDGPVYEEIEAAVRAIGRKFRGGPCGVQAALWTWRKRTRGIKYSSQLSLFDEGTEWDRVLEPDEIKPYPRPTTVSGPEGFNKQGDAPHADLWGC